MKKILNQITFHDIQKSYSFINEIAKYLGQKTKILFAEALLKEWQNINSKDHQYMLDSDIYRVAQSMGLEIDHN